MANLQSFRTAFHGFNRDDVVQYIETVNNQHDTALAAQREENQRLRKELEREREDAQTARECAADLTVNANIPEKYVPSAQQRMDLYRRIASIRTNDDASDVLDELIDRYGEPPKPVLALLDVALLRAAAVKAGVGDISQRGDKLKLRLDVFHPAALSAVCAMPKYRRSLLLSGTDTPTLTLTLPKGADVLETALTLVEDLQLKAQSPA